jgi:hypothetical protein
LGSIARLTGWILKLGRLFVSTQTYDIPCDPRQPARWLLLQAKNIQRSNQSGHTRAKNEIQDELEVLYNRTRREGGWETSTGET